jgi:hypothetical protein
MWFCEKCKWWFHFSCCKTTDLERHPCNLTELMAIPLLKGGPLGLIGTAPLVFQAAMVVKILQDGKVETGADWEDLLNKSLGCTAVEFLDEMKEGSPFLNSEIECPNCDS